MEIILAVIGSSAFGILITEIFATIRASKQKKAESNTQSAKDLEALKQGQKYLMYYIIRTIGTEYIKEGEVDFDDRRLLSQMHDCYHNSLKGNGDLDVLMDEVNALPLKVKAKK